MTCGSTDVFAARRRFCTAANVVSVVGQKSMQFV